MTAQENKYHREKKTAKSQDLALPFVRQLCCTITPTGSRELILFKPPRTFHSEPLSELQNLFPAKSSSCKQKTVALII